MSPKHLPGRDLDPPPFTGEGDHAKHGGGGVAGAPCVVIHDAFGPWPLDFVPLADGEDDGLPPQAGTLIPTIVGVVLIATILALALIALWQWWRP